MKTAKWDHVIEQHVQRAVLRMTDAQQQQLQADYQRLTEQCVAWHNRTQRATRCPFCPRCEVAEQRLGLAPERSVPCE